MEKEASIKVSLFGAAGRMGVETASMLRDERDIEVVNMIEKQDHPAVGTSLFGVKISDQPFDLPLTGTIFCDFTVCDSALKNAALAAEMDCPILIGTTGFNEEQLTYLRNLSGKIPLMIAPNLSRGVDLLYRLAGMAASALKAEYEAEIVETHHKWKIDAPSGTAAELKKILTEKGRYKDPPTHSLRIGDFVGEHRVIFGGEGETITIIHRAQSRKAFAKGVPAALRFLAEASAGAYYFRDALGD